MSSQKTDTLKESDSSEEKQAPKKKPSIAKINRFSMGLTITIQLILAFICVCLFNYLTADKHLRKDLTQDSKYTLSDFSLDFLKGHQLQNHNGDIKIFIIAKPSPLYTQRLRSLLEEYARHSAADIEVEFIDRVKDANRLNEISAIYNKSFFEDSMLIDARTEEEKTKVDDPEFKASTVSLSRIRQFALKNLFQMADTGSHIVAWQDEKIITTFLLSAIEGKPRKFYFIVDKSEIDDQGEGTPAWRTFRTLLADQNIHLAPYQISSNEPIPSDAEGLAIIGLDVDFDERELEILNEYWGRNAASIFITVKPDAKIIKMRRFLASYGIKVENDQVTTMKNGRKLSTARAIFVRGNEITKGFGDQATQLDGVTRSLTLVNVDQLESRNISVYSILNSAPGWWGEVSYDKEKAQFDPGKDNGTDPNSPIHRPVPIACAVVRGRQNIETTKHLTSKMIVVGNTQFLKPNNMREELTHFTISSINWLAGREDLVGKIGQKPAQNQKITIPEEQKSKINFTVIAILPCISALIGLIVWFNRRS